MHCQPSDTSRRGCRHCVTCTGVCLHETARKPMSSGSNTMLLWPAGLQSPTVYFLVKERQLRLQIQAAATIGPHAWRHESVAGGLGSMLLQRRGLPQLAVLLPHAATGVELTDRIVYLRSVDVACGTAPPPTIPPPRATAAPTAAACQAAHTQQSAFGCEASLPLQWHRTPNTQQEQRAKRSRLQVVAPGAAIRVAAADGHRAAPCTHWQRGTMPSSRGQAAGAAAAVACDDPHGVFAWLHKIKSMLSPAAQRVACAS